MNRRLLGTAACSVAAVSAVAQPADSKDNERPNIVVIIADDLLSSELGCYGGQNIETPNIDRLAHEGV